MVNLKISNVLRKYKVSKDEIGNIGLARNKNLCLECGKMERCLMLSLPNSNWYCCYCKECGDKIGYEKFMKAE